MAVRVKGEIRLEYWSNSDKERRQVHSARRPGGWARQRAHRGDRVPLGELADGPVKVWTKGSACANKYAGSIGDSGFSGFPSSCLSSSKKSR